MITEDQLEQLALDWFGASGYSTAYGPDIACDGDSLLTGELSAGECDLQIEARS